MKIIIGNVRSIIIDANIEEKRKIKAALSIKDPRTGFVRGSFNKNKVSIEKMYSEINGSIVFYSGLLPEIKNILLESHPVVDNRIIKFDYQNNEYSHEELRAQFNPNFKYVEHQIRALSSMLSKTKGVIKATTSSGKTEIIIAFMKLSNLKTLVIAPKVDLANQIKERIEKAGLECGIMTGSTKKFSDERICVATPQMATHISDYDFDCIICDECHHCCSKTYQEMFSKTKAKAIFGFSATPDTNKVDWMKIRQFCGGIIEEIKSNELVENDVIVFPEINFVPISQKPTINWETANELCIMGNEERNTMIGELCRTSPSPALILIRNIEHGKKLASMIDGSIFLSGSDDNKYRNEIFDKFENKEIPVLIGTIGILSEGISLNSIRTLIISQGGKSDIITAQSLGRALRRDGNDKKKAIVYDFYDYGNKYTEKHSMQRASMYREIGFPVNIKKKAS